MVEKLFPNNVHTVERVGRFLLGIAGLAFAVLGPEGWVSWLGLLGLIPLLTGLAGSCPMYTLFGVSTCSLGKKTGS